MPLAMRFRTISIDYLVPSDEWDLNAEMIVIDSVVDVAEAHGLKVEGVSAHPLEEA